jgi:hypothetical protein
MASEGLTRSLLNRLMRCLTRKGKNSRSLLPPNSTTDDVTKNPSPSLPRNLTLDVIPEPFQYRDLDSSCCFRIAILQPGVATDDIKVSLLHTHFDQNPSFEALSYVWGDPTVTRPIIFEGHSFNVTVNLFLALRRLRYEDKPRHLWIDALCINQDNIPEREHQISRMRDIYSGASRAVIWAGGDDKLADSAHHLSGLLLAAFRDNPDILTENTAQRLITRNIILSHEWFEKHAKSAVHFLGNEWFRRVWTFQEAYLCREAEFVCGKLAFPWKPFVFTWKMLEILGIRLPLDGMQSAKTVFATCCWAIEARGSGLQQEENPLRLSNLLRSTYTHLSSDPRDRIFGLLAMVRPREGVRFVPDYTATVEDVYIRYARLMIQDDGHLQVLSDANNRGSYPALPSWVPDWRETFRVNSLVERTRDFKPKYSIHGGFDPQEVITRTGDPRKLHLRGARVGKVQNICSLGSLMRQVRPGVQLGKWRGVVRMFREYFNLFDSVALHLPPTYSRTGEPMFSAFVKTLAGDDLPTSNRGSKDDTQHFFPWCHDYQSLTWKEAFRPLILNEEVMGDSPYASVVGAPVQEVLDFLFDKERPTIWSFPAADILERLKVETIYRQIVDEILRVISEKFPGRLLLVTDNGYLGIGPDGARVGDYVYDLLGADVPSILRETETEAEFILLGDTYVHGIMDGELWRLASDGNGLESVDGTLSWDEIVLV